MRRIVVRLYRRTIPKAVHNTLIRLGGSDPAKVRELEFHHQIRQAGFGISLVMAGILASVAGGHTAYSIGHNMSAAVFFGALWGALVTALDYQILLYINSYNKSWVAFLRITTSLVLSLLTSTPIVLLCSRGPITQYLNEQKAKQREKITAGLADYQVQMLAPPLKEQETHVRQLQAEYLSECDGSQGTHIPKIGPVAKVKQQAYLKAQTRLEDMRRQAAAQLQQRTAETNLDLKDMDENFGTDELSQLRALFALLGDPAILVRWILLMAAIVLCEMSPLVLKLSNLHGNPYTELVEELQAVQTLKVKLTAANEIRALQIDARLREEADTYTYNLESKRLWVSDKTADADLFSQGLMVTRKWSIDQTKMHVKLGKGSKAALDAIHTKEKQINQDLLDGKPHTKAPGADGQPAHSLAAFYTNARESHVIFAANLSPDHPFRASMEMFNQALLICGPGATEKERVHLLFTYMKNNFTYDDREDYFLTGRYRTAEDVWNDRKGVCGETVALFCALGRCIGLDVHYAEIRQNDDGVKVWHAAAYVRYADGSDPQMVDVAEQSESIRPRDFEVLSDSEVTELFKQWRTAMDA